ncbi:hypothetical protein K474DRAFT_1438036 [Panus rudis PR-1116 ss-1]|nr:hypothetical protein K474DRAFT_1438036 [Panus rudis PR-1116 ss-1]
MPIFIMSVLISCHLVETGRLSSYYALMYYIIFPYSYVPLCSTFPAVSLYNFCILHSLLSVPASSIVRYLYPIFSLSHTISYSIFSVFCKTYKNIVYFALNYHHLISSIFLAPCESYHIRTSILRSRRSSIFPDNKGG